MSVRKSTSRQGSAQRMGMGKLRGQPSTMSLPVFRFNVGEDDIEEIEATTDDVFPENDAEKVQKSEDNGLECVGDSEKVEKLNNQGLSSKSRSVSFDNTGSVTSASDSNDAKSLFSELKESVKEKVAKTAKNLEEKIGREISGSAVLGIKVNTNKNEGNRFCETIAEDCSSVSGTTSTSQSKIMKALEPKPVLNTDVANDWDNSERFSPELMSALTVKECPSKGKLNELSKTSTSDFVEVAAVQVNTPSVSQTILHKRKSSGPKNVSTDVSMSMSSLLNSKNSAMDESEEATENWKVDTKEEERTSRSSTPVCKVKETKDENSFDSTGTTQSDLPWWNHHRYFNIELGPRSWILSRSMVVLLLCIVPLPSIVCGFILGILLSTTFVSISWLLFPSKPTKPKWVDDITVCFREDSVEILTQNFKENSVLKCWMNELTTEYVPEDYHINQTRSVYVRLEGESLRLSQPKVGISKRATWDEPKQDPVFVHQRYFNMIGCNVLLLPVGLAKKRVWSKKYPICLMLRKEASDNPPCSSEDSDREVIYLFARTCREKEEWFRKFQNAARIKLNEDKGSKLAHHKRSNSSESNTSVTSLSQTSLDYESHVSKLIKLNDSADCSSNSKTLTVPVHSTRRQHVQEHLPTFDCRWVNAVIGRTFWDFLTIPSWAELIAEKIQKKLSKIKVPYFIEELTLTDIELGNSLPVVHRASKPYHNDRGIWMHFDVTYSGSFCMTLETKLNLMRLKKVNTSGDGCNKDATADISDTDVDVGLVDKSSTTRSHLYDSDAEDSAESSSDEEMPSNVTESLSEERFSVFSKAQQQYRKHVVPVLKNPLNKKVLSSSYQGLVSQTIGHSGNASKKLLRILDKIAQSKYFQQATDIKYVKKKMEEVSNTRLLLTVEVHNLAGTLVMNIPPPPTDRLWYGFHGNPKLWISARPKLGERQVTITHITDWIEKKLVTEFQRVLVLPNMDDLIIPIMDSKLDANGQHVENTSDNTSDSQVSSTSQPSSNQHFVATRNVTGDESTKTSANSQISSSADCEF